VQKGITIALVDKFILIGLYVLIQKRDRELSESPPSIGEPSKFETNVSTISVSNQLLFSQLAVQANNTELQTYSDGGS